VSGYQGFIFCPDNRLCKYSDLAPPTSRQKADNLNISSSIERLVYSFFLNYFLMWFTFITIYQQLHNSKYSVILCQLSISFLYRSDHDVKETDATPHPNLVHFSSVTVSKPEIIVATVLSIMAAFSLLSAAVLIYRKCSSASVRVHAANEPPFRLQFPLTQCIRRIWW